MIGRSSIFLVHLIANKMINFNISLNLSLIFYKKLFRYGGFFLLKGLDKTNKEVASY